MLFATFTLHLPAGFSTTRYTHTHTHTQRHTEYVCVCVRERERRIVCSPRIARAYTRSCACSRVSTRPLVHTKPTIRLCGWNCRTAVHPVGCVGCVRRLRLRWYLVNFRPRRVDDPLETARNQEDSERLAYRPTFSRIRDTRGGFRNCICRLVSGVFVDDLELISQNPWEGFIRERMFFASFASSLLL